jgi:hypothetical protein
MATTSAPVSGKAYGAFIGTALLGVVTFILTTYVPYFHHVLPPTLAQLLPVLCGAIGAFAGAWFVKHQVTPAELEVAVTNLEKMYAAVHPLTEVKGELVSFTPQQPGHYKLEFSRGGGVGGATGSPSRVSTQYPYADDPIPPELTPNPITTSGGATPPDSGQ